MLYAAWSKALTEAGYCLAKPHIYKATWSSEEVEHFVYLEDAAKQNSLVTAYFGIRNPIAESFAVKCIRVYGGELIFDSLAYDPSTSCAMRFWFGRLMPEWPQWSLSLLTLPNRELESKTEGFIGRYLLPTVQSVTHFGELFRILVEDREPWPWFASNGAIRAAQIVALGKMTGLDNEQIIGILEPRMQWISRGFMQSSAARNDPMTYIRNILADDQIEMQSCLNT